MRGHDATRAIRAAGYRGVIVGVSGNALATDVEEFLAAGADAVQPKPVKMDELLAIFRQRLRV